LPPGALQILTTLPAFKCMVLFYLARASDKNDEMLSFFRFWVGGKGSSKKLPCRWKNAQRPGRLCAMRRRWIVTPAGNHAKGVWIPSKSWKHKTKREFLL